MAVHIVVVLFISGGLGGWCQILKGMCASFLLEGIYLLKRFGTPIISTRIWTCTVFLLKYTVNQ